METQKQIHCIASNSYGTTGTHQNLLQDLSKSITRLEKIIHGTKHRNRDMWWFVIRQAKEENTQQLNITQTIKELRWYVVSYDIIDPIEEDRTCGIMKITIKEKVNLSFDITANASTIRFFIVIQWTVCEAKYKTDRCQARINSQKVTIFVLPYDVLWIYMERNLFVHLSILIV